eukprot:Filipodium_phascolosomae@DN2554_c0_g2_i1.p1
MDSFMQRIHTLRDRDKLNEIWRNHKVSISAWGVFTLVALLIFWGFSDGDFSFLMTLSSLISLFTFVMVLYCIEKNRSCAGLSLKMMECYFVLTLVRLTAIVRYEGYLPYDKSGDWLYQTIEFVILLAVAGIVYACRIRYASTYDVANDGFNPLYLGVPAFILALMWHPTLNNFMPADVAWTFALYLESVCVFPQLWMFQKLNKVEVFTTHFLAGQALSKALSFFFWISSYAELNDHTKPMKKFAGLWVIVMQVAQLILMGDFIYQYVKCISKGVSVENILNDNV